MAWSRVTPCEGHDCFVCQESGFGLVPQMIFVVLWWQTERCDCDGFSLMTVGGEVLMFQIGRAHV